MPDYRLDGNNPLGYMGVRPYTPPQIVIRKQAPTVKDNVGFVLGTQWLWVIPDDPIESVQYVLVSLSGGIATWIPLNDGGEPPILDRYRIVLGTGAPGFTNLDSSGNTGQILTSQGPGLPPIWTGNGGGTGIGSINTIVFDTPGSGTYTPTAGMIQCIVECVGSGSFGNGSFGQNGSGGSYGRNVYSASEIGSSQPYIVSAISTNQIEPNNTVFGYGSTLMVAGGALGADPGPVIGGILQIMGQIAGQNCIFEVDHVEYTISNFNSGASGLFYGSGGPQLSFSTSGGTGLSGIDGSIYGGGGSGAVGDPGMGIVAGTGASGVIIITEYIAA